MGFILAIIATLLVYIFSPFLIIYGMLTADSFKAVNAYFFRIAVSIDQLGNVIGGPFFNQCAITPTGDQFGHEDETISSVLGKNHANQPRTFRLLGRSMRYYLDLIEPNHCVNSIGK